MIAPHTIAARASVDEIQTIEETRVGASRLHLLSPNPKSHISRWREPVDGAREAWIVRPGGLDGGVRRIGRCTFSIVWLIN